MHRIVFLGADVNKQDKNGMTAVAKAALFGHVDALRILVAAGVLVVVDAILSSSVFFEAFF